MIQENKENSEANGQQVNQGKPMKLTVITCLGKDEECKHPANIDKFGCKHYRRRCQKRCPDCLEFFTCRLCHDEVKYHNEWDPKKSHQLRRHDVKEIKCLNCNHIQKPQQNCEKCHIQFATYFCAVCNLFDNDEVEKEVYHCDKCGICRVGGREKSFHCDTCQACISIESKENHQCIIGTLKQACPVCLDDMHDSQQNVGVLRCGHVMHASCLEEYIQNHIACPICKKSAVDPKVFEEYYDEEISNSPMPAELRDSKMNILCNDCLFKSVVPFHIVGGKCKQCSSYNTTRIEDSEMDTEERLNEIAQSPNSPTPSE